MANVTFEDLESEREFGLWDQKTDEKMRKLAQQVMDTHTLEEGEFFAFVFLANGRGHFMALDGIPAEIKKAHGTTLVRLGSATYQSKRGPVKFYMYREPKK